jgi:predicted dinucleotide-binding enzyme
MRIGVIGTGYVGLVVGTGLAELGNDVICGDVDQTKIDMLQNGRIPIYEPGLAEMVSRNSEQGRLKFSTDIDALVRFAKVIFIAVGTPPDEDGSADLSHVLSVAETIGRAMDGYRLVIIKSTVPVGTATRVRAVLEGLTDHEFDVASNPEFLKEGAAVDDFMKPDRVVCGVENTDAAKQLSELYDGSDAHGALILGGCDAFVAHRAQLSLISDRTLASEGYMPIFSNRIKADSHSNVILRTFDFGDGNGLQLFKVQLREYASIESSHLLYISGNARMGTVSKIIHIEKNSSSRQKAKNILKEQSRGIFDALIKVERSGKYTKAHQNSKSILLNDGAHMVSKPQLEIYIDDLEASHGSTTGQLDEQQLFYLRSRGISKDEAKKMLILAFANELIDAVADDNIRENIHKSFEKAYYGHTYVACMETCHGCENAIAADKS